jgi:hypothetical protein
VPKSSAAKEKKFFNIDTWFQTGFSSWLEGSLIARMSDRESTRVSDRMSARVSDRVSARMSYRSGAGLKPRLRDNGVSGNYYNLDIKTLILNLFKLLKYFSVLLHFHPSLIFVSKLQNPRTQTKA